MILYGIQKRVGIPETMCRIAIPIHACVGPGFPGAAYGFMCQPPPASDSQAGGLGKLQLHWDGHNSCAVVVTEARDET